MVKGNSDLEVKILKVDTDARKIGLSLRRVQWAAEEEEATEEPVRKHVPEGPERVLSDDVLEQIKSKQMSEAKAKQAESEAEEDNSDVENSNED